METHLYCFILLAVFICLIPGSIGQCHQTRDGCKIEDNRCVCGHGCYTDYRYSSQAECQKALRGLRKDICRSQPCRNGGTCSQTTQDPGYKCRCEGTGYHGDRCTKVCPSRLTAHMPGEYPLACIVI